MKIVFMGTPDFSVPVLKMLDEKYDVAAVVTREDKPKGRKKVLVAPPVKEYAVEHGIEVLQPVTAKNEAFIARLREIAPDLLVTAAYGRILPQSVLDIPPLGCINVHASLLPKYRGAGPIQRAIIDGEEVTGITTMMTDIGMDTGDILVKRECAIEDWMNSDDLNDILMNMAPDVLDETLQLLQEGKLDEIRKPQDHEAATYAEMLTKDTGVIDWNQPARTVHNLVRGTFPWPAAWSVLNGANIENAKIKIAKTEVVEAFGESNEEEANVTPGTVMSADKKGITVACGEGLIKIIELQPESGKIMNVASFLNGRKVEKGDIFG